MNTSLAALVRSVSKYSTCKYFPKWRRDIDRYERGHDTNRLTAPD